MSPALPRTPVTLIAGLNRSATTRIADAMALPGTAVLAHDLSSTRLGQVTRLLRIVTADDDQTLLERLELEHSCASCTLRHDLLPLLRLLHRDSRVDRIVVLLDPILEPEEVVDGILGTVVTGDGLPPAPAGDDVQVIATVTCIDQEHWLNQGTGDITLHEAGFTDLEDERTVAQVAVAQVRFADAVIVNGSTTPEDAYAAARLFAVLERLAPSANIRRIGADEDVTSPLVRAVTTSLPPTARRGRLTTIFDPLLEGCPPLEPDCGVELVVFEADRPFHPERFHDALDVLLDGVVHARGRVWLTSSPDNILWLESAGGALGISRSRPWLAAQHDDDRAQVSDAVRAMAALRWDSVHGDRHSAIVVLAHRADPQEIDRQLTAALVTDDELAHGPAYLAALESPFGDAHREPCEDNDSLATDYEITTEENR